MSTKFNLTKHMKVVHSGVPKKYIKHIKKDKKFVCRVCNKAFKHSYNLKIHYGRDHSQEQLKDSHVPVAPIIHYSRRH